MLHSTLKNGARVLLQSRHYVLASWRGQFVFWMIDDEGNAYCGHYFDDDQRAIDYFCKRINMGGF